MNERLVAYNFSLTDPAEAESLSDAGAAYTMVPFGASLVYVVVSPFEDDASATLDIQDDGSDIVTGIDASDHDVPGEWISTHFNGTQTPIAIAAGSELSFDLNSVAAANRFDITLLFLSGETVG